jgi:hypothetical protein
MKHLIVQPSSRLVCARLHCPGGGDEDIENAKQWLDIQANETVGLRLRKTQLKRGSRRLEVSCNGCDKDAN